jgi:hypothetical protein
MLLSSWLDKDYWFIRLYLHALWLRGVKVKYSDCHELTENYGTFYHVPPPVQSPLLISFVSPVARGKSKTPNF